MEEKNYIKFSIIIPIFNAEKNLKRTVESVLNQTYKNFELILINDGSKDKSKEICEEYAKKDSRIKFINKENEGVSQTRNLGIEKAIYKYICFLDSDDYIENNMLEEYVNIINNHNDIQLINSGFFSEVYDEKNPQIDIINYNEKYYSSIKEIKKDFVILWDKHLLYNIWNKVYRKDIIQENNIKFPDYNWGEDIDFNRNYLLHINNMYNTKKAFYHYIRSSESAITGRYIPNLYDIRLRENEEFKEYFRRFGIPDNVYEEFCARRHIERTNDCIEKLFDKSCILYIKEKYKEIKKIINDDITKDELKKMKPKSKKVKILLIPYKIKSVFLAMIMGKMLATFKSKFPKLFNSLKNKR